MEINPNQKRLQQPKKIKNTIIGLGLLCALITAVVSIQMVTYSPRSKNEKAIKTVMTSLLTGPDTELTRLMELCATRVGPGFVEEPKPEDLERLDNKMKDMFGSYVSEETLNYIMTSGLLYHSISEEKGYEIRIEKIDINQDKKDDRNYTFTIRLEYSNPTIGTKQFVVNGRAQCLEAGKITFLRFSDDFFQNEFMNSN